MIKRSMPDQDENWQTHALDFDGGSAQSPAHLEQEWVLSNGAGGFAMGTASGSNTRRYHGLLVASRRPPVSRVVLLNQMLERLELGKGKRGKGEAAEFTTCLFQDDKGRQTVTPTGHTFLKRFEKGLSVKWFYEWGAVGFERELSLGWKQQLAVLRYRITGLDEAGGGLLRLSPMLTLRDFHSVLRKDGAGEYAVKADGDVLRVSRWDIGVTLQCAGASFVETDQWWYRFHYPIEAERGLDHIEDCFVPGGFELKLKPAAEHEVVVTVALGDEPAKLDGEKRQPHLKKVLGYVSKDVEKPAIDEGLRRQLVLAADDFVVDRMLGGAKLSTILAGYPWFADWGRDTFIALPGLLLTTGRFDEAKATLETFAGSIHNGLVPNRFDDYNEEMAHYNTVDASLWFINAAMQYYDATGDRQSWDGWLRDACLQIIDAYIRGTDCEIRTAGDGLVTAGGPGTQLTWMDAACNGVVFTPRHGKAVEINGLWYHALVGMAERIKGTHKKEADHFDRLAARIRRAFPKVFWQEQTKSLIDHVWTDEEGNEHADESIRPNQVFVAALPNSPMPMTKCRQITKFVKQHLLTPYGLRTLAQDDARYHADYRGGPYERDEAYHQGTIWPWLIGPYAEAVLRGGKFDEKSKREALGAVTPLLEHMAGGGLGQLAEIHEAKPPHRPVGCPAQAWSVAEVLRVVRLIETVEG